MTRAGLGFDAHAFDPSRPLILGGVTIPGSAGLAGHSDADVLSHAVADALLGAAGLGDIGDRFPATEAFAGADSLGLLADCVAELGRAGWRVINVDCTLIAERPKLAPFRDPMIANLARTIGIPGGAVSVKATTTDGMGFTGRGEGIAALVTALVDDH